MQDQELRDRLVEHGVTPGRYDGMFRLGILLTLIGVVLFVIALVGEGHERGWQAFHLNWLFFTGLAGGSVALTAVYKLANAKWAGLILRFAQPAAAFLPVSLIGLLVIFTAGYEPIYGHMHEQLHSLQHAKAVWLGHGFMAVRLIAVVAVITAVGWALIRADLVPDLFLARNKVDSSRRPMYEAWSRGFDLAPEARAAHQARIARLAAIFVPIYALGFTLVAFDMIMALQPHWFSNLLGGFFFMASFLGAHTLLALTMLYGEKQTGIHDLISPKQRHDLGKMIFGFTVFWTYLMWAQYLVIWYGNLPEETGFLFSRLWGTVASGRCGGGDRHVPDSVLGAARRRSQEEPDHTRAVRGDQSAGAMAGAISAGAALRHPRAGPAVRTPRSRRDGSDAGPVSGLLCGVCPDLPHGIAPVGRSDPRSRSPSR